MVGNPPALAPDMGSFTEERYAMGLIIGLLLLWVVLAVLGFVVKSLFWLAIVGIVLFLATGAFGAMRGRSRRGA
jgi:hypothetical protein